MSCLEVKDASADGVEFRQPQLYTGQRLIEFLIQRQAQRRLRVIKADCDNFLDLFQSQPQRTQTLGFVDTPQGPLVKKAIVAFAAVKRDDKTPAFIFAQDLDRHTGAPRKMSNSHRFRWQTSHHILPFTTAIYSPVEMTGAAPIAFAALLTASLNVGWMWMDFAIGSAVP